MGTGPLPHLEALAPAAVVVVVTVAIVAAEVLETMTVIERPERTLPLRR